MRPFAVPARERDGAGANRPTIGPGRVFRVWENARPRASLRG